MKKKLIYFVPTFPVISETFIEREISKLVEFNQLDITVLSLAKGRGSISENSKKVTRYRRLNVFMLLSGLLTYIFKPGLLVTVYKSSFSGSPFSFKNFYLFIKSLGYAKMFAHYKPDHIHVHFMSDPSTIVMIVSKLIDVPFSVSGHAKDVFLTGTLISQKVKSSKFVTICNSFAWNKCVEIAGTKYENKIYKIYHGINPKLFESPSKLQKPPRPLIFMGGTRFVEKKGIQYVLEAAKLLKDRGYDFQVDLVGSGDLYQESLDTIERLGLENNVIVHGDGKGIPFSEVAEYYKIADIFVLASIETGEGDADGVPTVVIEAAIAKMPIITTNAGSINDLIDTTNGIVVPQKDSKAIADGLEKLIKDPEFGKVLGAKAREKAIRMFDIDTNVNEFQKLLLA